MGFKTNNFYLKAGIVCLIIFIIGAVFIFTRPGNGTRLEFNGSELFYTKNISEAEARKLGEFLAGEELAYFDGQPKSVQLDKEKSNYIFRAVILKGIEQDPANVSSFADLGKMLSEKVFDNAPVIVEMCDTRFVTLKRIPFDEK